MTFRKPVTSVVRMTRSIGQQINPLAGATGSPAARLFALEGMLGTVVISLATAYTSMFASRLGATSTQIGLITSLPQIFALFILIPGTLLASRMRDQRRPVEIALLLTGFIYGLAGFSPYAGSFRTWILIGLVAAANIPFVVYNTSWQNYFSNIVPAAQRNDDYTLRTSMTFLAGLIVVQATGLILGGVRSDSTRILIYQVCYWLAFAAALAQLLVLRRLPSNVREDRPRPGKARQELLGALRESMSSKPFKVFLAISLLFHFGFYMSFPLFFIVQVNYLKANETWLSLITVASSFVQWLTVRPWGRYINRHGSSKALVIGCASVASNPFLYALALYLPQPIALPSLVFFNIVVSTAASAFQLSLLQCLLEVVPQQHKSLNLSIYSNFLILVNAVAPLVGVMIYNGIGMNLTALSLAMGISGTLRLTGTLLFLLRWRSQRKESTVSG